mmetsp:Transcript_2741/g.11747  ORF Transcript_2741/g.11747 Transcript_2741/m.11747 type:complete len:148 (-) Transcript_2741:1502-1945(-)
MSKEVGLRKTIDAACSQHFGMLREAQKENMFESKASTIIQKNWRSFAVRRNLKIIRKAAVEIQAGCRGRAGRILAHEHNLKVPRPNNQWPFVINLCSLPQAAVSGRSAHFHEAATKIQKYWRGRWSRHVTHSFHGRKRYIDAVLQTN